ncbi:MAG: hypothetical protein JO159_18120 [Acidobacteria bacterium]|nr:hypothetical protein [Acidobacteriota bacterium]MBV9623641.1 hypothetical protein [Acidobacteriota bacterium]
MARLRAGKRRNKRTKMVLPVRVGIMKGDGTQESHVLHTLDANETGVKLGGFRGELKVGDVIDIHYRTARAKFKVAWVRALENSPEKHLGAACMEPEKNIWTVSFPRETDQYEEKD